MRYIIDTIQREAILFSTIVGIQEGYGVGDFISYFDDYGDEEVLKASKTNSSSMTRKVKYAQSQSVYECDNQGQNKSQSP